MSMYNNTAHLSGRRDGREALERDFWDRACLVCAQHGTHSSPKLGTDDRRQGIVSSAARYKSSMQLMASCQRPSGFSYASNMLRRGQYWVRTRILERAELSWGRLAPGRAVHCSGQDGGYGVIITGQGAENVSFVIVIANTYININTLKISSAESIMPECLGLSIAWQSSLKSLTKWFAQKSQPGKKLGDTKVNRQEEQRWVGKR